MIFLIRFLSILAFLVADVRTGSSQDKGPTHCYMCGGVDNSTDCSSYYNNSQVQCTPDLPYCGTSAKSPDYISSLACTAGSQSPCTLIQTAMDTYEMTCTCVGHLCNKPFTREFRDELLNFSTTHSPDNTTRELLEIFMNSTAFANITVDNIYEAATVSLAEETSLVPVTTTVSSSILLGNVVNKEISSSKVLGNVVHGNVPRAQALKQEATVPSDDDEDEGEGSGTFDDVKPAAPAAPAAPSSFLPANENSAINVHKNLLATIPFIFLYTLA